MMRREGPNNSDVPSIVEECRQIKEAKAAAISPEKFKLSNEEMAFYSNWMLT